jgi:addiction module HigA family antidote
MKTMRPLQNYFAETLRDTIEDSGLTQRQIAAGTGIPASHLSEMKTGKRKCTAEHDIRLSEFFGIEPGLWMRLQLQYEFRKTEREKGGLIRSQVKHHAA